MRAGMIDDCLADRLYALFPFHVASAYIRNFGMDFRRYTFTIKNSLFKIGFAGNTLT